jgi:hypothetical protein
VGTRGQQAGHDLPGRLPVGQQPGHLTLLVEADRVRGVDDHLAREQVRVLRDQLLRGAEHDGEDDGVGAADRVLHGRGTRERPELAGERLRALGALRGEDDGFTPGHQEPGHGATDVSDAYDCGCHCRSSRMSVVSARVGRV